MLVALSMFCIVHTHTFVGDRMEVLGKRAGGERGGRQGDKKYRNKRNLVHPLPWWSSCVTIKTSKTVAH